MTMAEEKLIRIEIGAGKPVARDSRQREECAGKDAHDDSNGTGRALSPQKAEVRGLVELGIR